MTAGIAQLVERNLAKVEVVGSRPISRSTLSFLKISIFDFKRAFKALFLLPVCAVVLGFLWRPTFPKI